MALRCANDASAMRMAAGPAENGAFICSYECTFCATCANALNGICPNCHGELVRRPRRDVNKGPAGTTAASDKLIAATTRP